METINSGHNVAVVNAQKPQMRMGHIETRNSGPKVDVLHSKTAYEGWEQ